MSLEEASVSDAIALERVRRGDSGVLKVLYDRHAPWLTVRLGRRCADPGLVDEVVQDTFFAVWKGAGSFRGEGDVAAWIWGIGVRRLVDRLRSSRSIPRLASSTASAPSAEDEALLGVSYGDAGAALDRLSPELLAVIQATVLDGLTTREAARALKIPRGTVKSRVMRARAILREELT